MKAYEHYRNSGKPGIGMIPLHWKCTSLRYALSAIKDGTHGTYARTLEGEYLLSAKNVFPTGLQITDSDSCISIEDYASIIANGFPSKGDVLLCGVGTIGRVCYYDYDKPYAFQRSVTFLRANDKVNSRYLFYYLQSPNLEDDEKLGSNGTAQVGLYMGEVVKLPMLIPPLDEQIAIAAYLDNKVAQINTIVAEAKASIEEYKQWKASIIYEAVTKGLDPNAEMVDTGYDDIGLIPVHWKIGVVKNLFNVVCGATPSEHEINWGGNISWVGPADMPMFGTISEGRRSLSDIGYNSCGTTLVPKGSIVLSTRAPIGKICIATSEICTNQGCKCLVPKENDNTRFYAYYLFAITERMQQDGTGTTFKELATSKLKSEPLVLVPLEEQNAIAKHLDGKCSSIDLLIDEKESLICDLEAYKKSLIFEVVTGKRKVV